MSDNSEIIGDYRGTVKNRVLTALLQSYLDNLDYDGMKSILREAGLLELKDIRDVDPNASLDFFSFKKIIAAQNCLLYDSSNLLYEIGKKFSFYLFPFGKKFEEIIVEINDLIRTDWNVQIVEKKEDSITVRVDKCIFCSEIGVSCELFKGFLVHSLEKTLSSDFKVIQIREKENITDPHHNSFHLKLKIEKRFKTS
jgi:predicted hydrocarbon binding protein